MSMYAIKDTTLTALGDAVRSKVIGQSESEETFENLIFTNSAQYQNVNVNISAPKYRYIITGYIEGTGDIYGFVIAENETSTGSSLYGGTFDDLTEEQFPIVLETTYKKLRFRALTNSSETILHLDVVAVGLDENGNEFKYTPLEMAEKINGLETIPDSALNITGNCNYRFANGAYDWLINQCGEKMTTKNIDSMEMTFAGSDVEIIPFEINGYNGKVNVSNCFSGSKIKQLPKMNIPQIGPLSNLFNNAFYLREIPDDKWNVGVYSGHTNAYDSHTSIFGNCYGLRYITPKLLSNIWNKADGYYYSCYYNTFYNCYVLDELIGLPVASGNYTNNAFSSTFGSCSRIKDMIFAVNEDGTPKTANWKLQTIDLSLYVGYSHFTSHITNYNSGITADKEVKDDATYQALKNDPDWFSCDVNYSRYNHDSAVNTINSLPDCSATGTNTIKFSGAAGALTDGGAINTLTEEEIAVATAKGWTVSLV